MAGRHFPGALSCREEGMMVDSAVAATQHGPGVVEFGEAGDEILLAEDAGGRLAGPVGDSPAVARIE